MQKLFHIIVEMIFWIAIFASPVLLSLIPAAIIYFKNGDLLWLSISIVSLGFVLGVFFAEKIRKKYGCANYMGRIIFSTDALPVERKE